MIRFLVIFLVLMVGRAFAWGPHGKITRAALDTLDSGHPLRMMLGEEFAVLTNYCWIPDFYRLPFRGLADDFYADDALLFPGVERHLDHICPEVERAWKPYFNRALQALRMESAPNAARWVGSLLHYVQDSGSPPHALQIRGETHIRMENWVDASKISLGEYQPKMLGTNDADALIGFESRMSGLVEFSRTNGQRLRTWVLLYNRRSVEPVTLASAIECARVSADVLHTISMLAATQPAGGIDFAGRVVAPKAVSPARIRARLIFGETNLATIADEDGRFVVHGLSRGTNTITVIQPGCVALKTNVLALESKTNILFVMRGDGNLARNADFSTRWISTNQPDCWTKLGGSWEGEVIALKPGQKYRVLAEFSPRNAGEVIVRWSAEQEFVIPRPTRLPRIHTRVLTRQENSFEVLANTNNALMQFVIRDSQFPTNSVKRVEIVAIED